MNDENPYQPPQSAVPASLRIGRPPIGTAKQHGLRRPVIHWVIIVLYSISAFSSTRVVLEVLNAEQPPANAIQIWLRTVLPLLALLFFRHDRRVYYFVSVMMVVDLAEMVYQWSDMTPFGESEPPFPGLFLLVIYATAFLQIFLAARFIFGRPSRAYFDLAHSRLVPGA